MTPQLSRVPKAAIPEVPSEKLKQYRESAHQHREKEKEYLELLDRKAQEAAQFGNVSATAVEAPLKRWVLLRKDRTLCAIRFTALRHERAKEGLASWSRDSFLADYDWFYQKDGSQDLAKTNVNLGHGQASRFPNLWRVERGKQFVECGSIKAQWWYPTSILLVNRNYRIPYDPKISDQPNGIEIALTGWQDIGNVNAQDKRLLWYRFESPRDSSRTAGAKKISVSELPSSR